MYTRQQYMDGLTTHDGYYGQFVTPSVLSRVKATFGVARLLQSKDPHFNDIPLIEWDDIYMYGVPPELTRIFKECDDYLTKVGLVCIAKTAARQIVAKERN